VAAVKWTRCVVSLTCLLVFLGLGANTEGAQRIRLARHPALSPDGSELVFSWRGDIWIVDSKGGLARPMTHHAGDDSKPAFSPNGREIGFTSDRFGANQVMVMSRAGSDPVRLTYHSEGCRLETWDPMGRGLIVSGARDHFWRHANRFLRVPRAPRMGEQLLFDAHGSWGRLSADGTKLLFMREGTRWWRKGYTGSQSAQIWLYNLTSGRFDKILEEKTGGCRYPLWKPDGSGFYYVSQASGSFNLWVYDLSTGKKRALTAFSDDAVLSPCLSKDGSTLVFRHLFDLYALDPTVRVPTARRINIRCSGDFASDQYLNRTLSKATDMAMSSDGLNIAFIAGGDLWVMDTELREPRQITKTAEQERSPVWAPDGKSLLFLSDFMDQCDIWRARPKDASQYWWQNTKFEIESLTNDSAVESRLKWSPDGERLAFVRGRGDLLTMDREGKQLRSILRSWNAPQYSWSPDGQWIAYSVDDNDFNRDIWVVRSDGQGKAFNLSRHPDNDSAPIWSPDGRMIAFTGRRFEDEVDIYFVHLQKREAQSSSRDRTLKKALERMKKGSKGKSPKSAKKGPPKKPLKKAIKPVRIDFKGIHERIRRVSIANSREGSLMWSPDSKKLAFSARVNGKSGLFTISLPADLRPKFVTAVRGSGAVWLKNHTIAWLVAGVPATLDSRSRAAKSYPFKVYQRVDLNRRNRAAFDLCWRAMRDIFYDGSHNNRNWSAIRRKYRPLAGSFSDLESLRTIVSLMLGELNGSHLGFSVFGGGKPGPSQWRESTAHFGLRFDLRYKGPGLKVKDVIAGSPAAKHSSRIRAGEVLLSVDGRELDSDLDLSRVLNGRLDRDMVLKVQGKKARERTVILRPISYRLARSLLYKKWIKDNRSLVNKWSKGGLGYVHIRGMNWSSFLKFEEELYSAGAGKDGLVIDVRENGGGFTTDHLLTVLTQPDHSITVPRGGGRGYPHGRRVYATWNKPIIVLCNQNSFSNAEIFSHAIKTLKRGRLVGVPTAGGVISTGGTRIMDFGFLRLPFRGWYLLRDGEDMELNGARPDTVLWPHPGDWPAGRDSQLREAVRMLSVDVRVWKKKRRPGLRKASERK
jgi:tricorn protease